MPWDKGDAKHKTKKASTDKKQRQWKEVANSAKKAGDSDATAIRKANGVIKKSSKKGKK